MEWNLLGDKEKAYRIGDQFYCVEGITPVAWPIFGPHSRSFFHKWVFKNEISSSALFDMYYGVIFFYPRIRKFDRKPLSRSLCQKEAFEISFLKNRFCVQAEGSTSSAEQNFPDEITWITWKRKQNLEIWLFLKSDSWLLLRENRQQTVLLPALGRVCTN